MAERPIFLPSKSISRLVDEISIPFTWNPGMAPVQKKKNIQALHASAREMGHEPILECSTKSDEKLGTRLSAFNLLVEINEGEKIPLECAFQGGKVFEHGGPFTDLYKKDSRDAKRDARLTESGKLVAFEFQGKRFPLRPKTAFYDYLFIKSIYPHREYLTRLQKYAGFSDIEFNPGKSINCQARTVALFVSLQKRLLLDSAMTSPEKFIEIIRSDSLSQPHSFEERQGTLI